MAGFIAAMLVGIPFGLMLAVSRTAYGIGFPVFEVLRPIPPLAWVPASIIFWPTQELSIAFVTFLGAFLHHRDQRRRRRALDRRALLPGGALDGLEPIGYLLAHHPAGHAAVDHGRLGGRHGHHLGGRGRGGDDLGRRQPDRRHQRRRPRVSSSGTPMSAAPTSRSSSA